MEKIDKWRMEGGRHTRTGNPTAYIIAASLKAVGKIEFIVAAWFSLPSVFVAVHKGMIQFVLIRFNRSLCEYG
jgi:hypothetical protein